jgi:MFS family permease
MENMDATVIATALPTIAREFGESPLRLNLAISVYLLSLAIFIPLSGWLADRLGARTVFCSAIVVFTLGSIGCSLVETLTPCSLLLDHIQRMGNAAVARAGAMAVEILLLAMTVL